MKFKELEKSNDLANLKARLELQMQLDYCNGALKLLGLKIGDTVYCKFRSSYIEGKRSYGTSVIQEGVIKQDEKGIIFIESTQPVQQTYTESNGRIGSSYRTWWATTMKITRAELSDIKEPC